MLTLMVPHSFEWRIPIFLCTRAPTREAPAQRPDDAFVYRN